MTHFLAHRAYNKFWLPTGRRPIPWCARYTKHSNFFHPIESDDQKLHDQHPSLAAGLYLYSYQGQRFLHLAKKHYLLQGRDGLHFYKRTEPLDAPLEESRQRKRKRRLLAQHNSRLNEA